MTTVDSHTAEKNLVRTLEELDERAKAAAAELLDMAEEFRQAVDAFDGTVDPGRLRGLREAATAADEVAVAAVRTLGRFMLHTR